MIYLGLYTDLKAIGVWIGFLFELSTSSFLSTDFFKSDQLIKLK